MNLLNTAIEAAYLGGIEILKIYNQDFEVETKSDNSPLTLADKNANAEIIKILKQTNIPIISEEIKAMDFSERKNWNKCWIVDPLDGTKEFIKKNGEFTVNIALTENGVPTLGVVLVPVIGKLYFAEKGLGSYSLTLGGSPDTLDYQELKENAQELSSAKTPEKFTIVASRSHLSTETEAFINQCKEKYGEVETVSKGSSIKLCLVAEGKANVYPRIAPTMEWDTAAAHAVAKYAGCEVIDFETREELKYNKENLLNPYFIVQRI